MNPEDFKFKFKDIDLKDFYESKIDYDFLKKYIKDFDWNLPNNISTTEEYQEQHPGIPQQQIEEQTYSSKAFDSEKYTSLMRSKLIDDYKTLQSYERPYAVKSSFSDMDVIIGMDHSGQMHIIKNERGEEGVKTININIIMRMFIQALRTGIMKFASNDKFKIFSEAIEKDLENAIMNIVNKYDLNRPERLPKWEKKSPLKFYEP